MKLPDDVIALIHDFDRPVTRPDWRTLHRMPSFEYYIALAKLFNRDTRKKIYATAICYNSNYGYLCAFYQGKPRISYVYGPTIYGMVSVN
jgi:hypothetical protein